MADEGRLQKLFFIAMHFFVVVVVLLDYASAQQNITQKIYALCNTAVFTSNSPFSRNLNNVLNFLSQNSSSSLYHSASSISNTSFISTTSDSQSDNAYAVYQCRGDLSLSDCSACVSSILLYRPCRLALGTRVQFLGCFLRYEYFDFIGIGETTFVKQNCSSSTNPNSSFQRNLATVLNDTATAAPSHDGFSASSHVSTGQDSAYALAQCLGYLNSTQCATCLAQVSSHNIVCGNAVAGQVYFVTCYYLYSDTPLLLSPATSDAEVAKARSKIEAEVAAIAGVMLLGAALATLFLFRKRKQKANESSAPILK